MHATVACLGLSDGGVAVAAGPMWAQYDPDGWVEPSKWLIVNIKEGGVGEGDTVRVYKDSEDRARTTCANGPIGGFPGYIYDGNFNIREK
jgi:hypothetical protein